jgi:uncharacterized protein
MAYDPEDVIRILSLVPLPREGGFFRETYRSALRIPASTLPAVYTGPRHAGTAIYFLLTPDTVSLIHRLPGDEVFHFYLGDPVEMVQLHPNGKAYSIIIGSDLERGMQPQVVVPAGVWQGSRLVAGGRFALMGTTMAPGFEGDDFEVGNRAILLRKFPEYAHLIRALTPEE